jgi:hypothetical protein
MIGLDNGLKETSAFSRSMFFKGTFRYEKPLAEELMALTLM